MSGLIGCPRCQGVGMSVGWRDGYGIPQGQLACPDCDGAGRIADRRRPVRLRPTGFFLYLILAAMLAAGFLAGRASAHVAAPRSAQVPPDAQQAVATAADTGRSTVNVGQGVATPGAPPERTGAPQPSSGGLETGAPPSPAPLELLTRTGILSHMGAGWPADYLALPWGRGIRATICGPGACWAAVSTDVGPNQRIHPDRVADVSAERFELICGVPASRGLCSVTVTRLP